MRVVTVTDVKERIHKVRSPEGVCLRHRPSDRCGKDLVGMSHSVWDEGTVGSLGSEWGVSQDSHFRGGIELTADVQSKTVRTRYMTSGPRNPDPGLETEDREFQYGTDTTPCVLQKSGGPFVSPSRRSFRWFHLPSPTRHEDENVLVGPSWNPTSITRLHGRLFYAESGHPFCRDEREPDRQSTPIYLSKLYIRGYQYKVTSTGYVLWGPGVRSTSRQRQMRDPVRGTDKLQIPPSSPTPYRTSILKSTGLTLTRLRVEIRVFIINKYIFSSINI